MESFLSEREIDNLLGDEKYVKPCYNKDKTEVCKFLNNYFCSKYEENMSSFDILQGCTCCERVKINE